jgi:Protein of unknown function (DUF2752)
MMNKLTSADYKRFVLVTGISAILVLFWFINPLNILFPKCPVYLYTGLYCTGCGSQRSLHAFLNGNIADACRQNFLATICYIALFAEIILLAVSKTAWRPSVLLRQRYAALIVLVALLIFTILRNIPVYPFTMLAPFL